MTWLPLALSLSGGGRLALVGGLHSARLRAINGKNKSDVIDAAVLARADDALDLTALVLPTPAELALRRAVTRRAAALIDANRSWRRLVSLARRAFPDVCIAFAASLPPESGAGPVAAAGPAGRAPRASLTAVVAEHTRSVAEVPDRSSDPFRRKGMGAVLRRETGLGCIGVGGNGAPGGPGRGERRVDRATIRPPPGGTARR